MGEAWRWGVKLHSISFSLEHILSKPRMAVTFAFLMYEPDCNAVVSRGTQSIAINASYRLIHKGNCEARSPCMKDACKHAKRHRWFNVLLSTAAAEGMFYYM